MGIAPPARPSSRFFLKPYRRKICGRTMPVMREQITMTPVLLTPGPLFVMVYKNTCNGNLYSQRMKFLHCKLKVCTNE